MIERTDVAIIGAGPYALSLGAHLRSAGIDYRIFGRSMDLWRNHMPEGMLLKSDGFASNLDSPGGEFSLSDYCQEHEIEYDDMNIPVRLNTFVNYGMEFQRRFVPNLEEQLVTSLDKDGRSYRLTLEDGSILQANRVVVAIGVGCFQYVPPVIANLPSSFVSHSYANPKLAQYVGRRVIVVGSGASALDISGLLNEHGCDVHLVSRKDKLVFGSAGKSGRRSVLDKLRYPSSGLGHGWKSRLCTDAPLIFHAMPERFRLEAVRRHLGPAASWRMKDKVVDRLPISTGSEIVAATVKDGGVELSVRTAGKSSMFRADHIISATGYRVDLRRLDILSPSLLARISCAEHSPILSNNFESSVDGLFFLGLAAANSFGPLLRFAFGARFAARRLSRYLTTRPSVPHSGFLENLRGVDSQTRAPQRI